MNLTALQHSPFLQSLGWAIANSLWQAAALWMAYQLVIAIYKNASAKFKNNLSTILLSSAFVWFCITLFNKFFALQNIANYEAQYYEIESVATAGSSWNELLNRTAAILPYLSIAYLLLLIFLSLRLINIYRFTRFIKFNGLQKPRAEWKLFTEKVARHMGITKKISLWVSHHIDVPATIGFIKPVILIPFASVNQLSADQLEAIILHELSHIKRNDYLINLFISIIETILFFNPFIVLLSRIIKKERENCCDDFVIQYQYDRHTYASALLSLEQFRNLNLRLVIGATSGKKQLLVRVKRIMEVSANTNFNYGQKLVALLLITGVICSVAWLSPQNSERRLQLTKNNNKAVEKKEIMVEKPSGITLTQAGNKLKKVILKSQLKKALSKTETELKELKNLNFKELAALEQKRINLLLFESKKEISRKKIAKFNINKSVAPRTFHAHSLLDNGRTFLPVKAMANTFQDQLHSYSFELQKFQAEWDKAHFSFSFDNEQIENTVRKALHSAESKRLINQKLKQADLEKMFLHETKNSGEKKLRRVIVNGIPKVYAGAYRESFYMADSIIAAEMKLVNERTRQTVRGNRTNSANENKKIPETTAYVYLHGYDAAGNEERVTKISGSANNRSMISDKHMPAQKTSAYHIISNGDCPAKPKNTPKTKTTSKENIRLEYRNGIIIINDKEIKTDKLVAQYLPKRKKISVTEQQTINIHFND